MKDRIVEICHHSFRQSSFKKLFGILLKNSYPPKLLNKLLFSTYSSLNLPNANEIPDGPAVTKKSYRKFPCIVGLSHQISKIFTSPDIQIANYNLLKVGSFYSHLKDKTPTNMKCDVIYHIGCLDCNLIYLGQTTQRLKRRITQHISDSKVKPKFCALATHVKQTGHRMDFEGVQIIETEPIYSRRLFLETYHINKFRNSTMNFKTDMNNLCSSYIYLLSLDKFQHKIKYGPAQSDS